MTISIIPILEFIGTIAFAISGAMVAMQRRMDLLGVCILGMTTAVGGGVIRDLVLGVTPPLAFRQPIYALTALLVSFMVFLPFVRQHIRDNGWCYWLIDSLGLAVFTVVGASAGVPTGNPFLIVFVGSITGVGGGLLRDLFAGREPIIFQKNIYATASLAGAVAFVFLLPFGSHAATLMGGCLVFVLRMLAMVFRWDLPRA